MPQRSKRHIVLVILIVGGAFGATPAVGATISLQRTADLLSHRIRDDARRGGPVATTFVRVRTVGPHRTLDVFYRARPATPTPCPPAPFSICQEFPRDGAYHLQLRETTRGRPLAITIHEFGTEPGYRLGTEPEDHASSLSYLFQMTWTRRIPQYMPREGMPGWISSVSYSELTFGSSHVVVSAPGRAQAIEVAKKAALRSPVTGESVLQR